jgi:hypothetical protein
MEQVIEILIEIKDFLIFHCFIGKFYPYSIVTLLLHCNMLYVTILYVIMYTLIFTATFEVVGKLFNKED